MARKYSEELKDPSPAGGVFEVGGSGGGLEVVVAVPPALIAAKLEEEDAGIEGNEEGGADVGDHGNQQGAEVGGDPHLQAAIWIT